jgi:TRAP-type C4-dicarboxylate transport system substrate-binding protein
MPLSGSIRRPLAIAAAMIATGASVQGQTVLTVSSWLPPAHILPETQKAWCTEFEQKAAGKVRCDFSPRR